MSKYFALYLLNAMLHHFWCDMHSACNPQSSSMLLKIFSLSFPPVHIPLCACVCTNLHKLERSLKVFHRVHFDSEELHAHDEADDALHNVRTLLFLPQLLQLCDELLAHCLKPARRRTPTKSSCTFTHVNIRSHTRTSGCDFHC